MSDRELRIEHERQVLSVKSYLGLGQVPPFMSINLEYAQGYQGVTINLSIHEIQQLIDFLKIHYEEMMR